MAKQRARRPRTTASAPAKAGKGPGGPARPTKGGRYTPRATGGAGPAQPARNGTARTPAKRAGGAKVDPGIVSGRYTPPIPRARKASPMWVPILLFSLIGLGIAGIVANYLGVLPGGASNWYLLGGLGLILAGFVTATQYR